MSSDPSTGGGGPVRRGRPPGTSARELELVALRLFGERGFEQTTVDDIAAGAGVSRRTFFRYFDSKAEVLWSEFDTEVSTIRTLLNDVPGDLSVVGYNDIPDAERSDPPLTTVDALGVQKGRTAARIVFDGGPPRHEILKPRLIIRASTGPAPVG